VWNGVPGLETAAKKLSLSSPGGEKEVRQLKGGGKQEREKRRKEKNANRWLGETQGVGPNYRR